MSDGEIADWLKSVANVQPLLPANVLLSELLSVGGQGIVFRGTVDGLDAAVKVYLPDQIDRRIEREIQALVELSCPTIVDLLWSQKVRLHDNELHVVATSFVEGTPLDKVVARREPVPEAQLGIIGYDVALAIQAMWNKRIVHRDLKPSNIVMRPDTRACVIDLGFARHLKASSLTQTGSTWGTRGYLSPEQARFAKQLSCKSDIYSLGVILIEAAIGRHPTLRNQEQLMARNLHLELPTEISDWTHAGLLMRMLEPNHFKRPSPEELLSALSMYE